MDFILNGQANGGVASRLLQNGMNTNTLRPYSLPTGRTDRWGQQEYGGTFITVNKGGKLVAQKISNAQATLRKDDWILLDTAIIRAATSRLAAVAAFRSRNLVHTIPNGMGVTVLQSQSQSDINDAEISINGVRESRNDRPQFDLVNLPLPIIHKDFNLYLREIEASRRGGSPLDTTTAELAGVKVAELAEKLTIGTGGAFSFGGGNIYGLTNYPDRITADQLTLPTDTSWTPQLFIAELLAMKQQSVDAKHFGPWIVFNSPAWDPYLDDDYSAAKGDNTLRERALKIKNLADMVTLDFMTGYQIVMVQLTPDVMRMVMGMDVTTLQWEEKGGLEFHFKVMTIQVPQLRSDYNGNTGIVHGVAS